MFWRLPRRFLWGKKEARNILTSEEQYLRTICNGNKNGFVTEATFVRRVVCFDRYKASQYITTLFLIEPLPSLNLHLNVYSEKKKRVNLTRF